MKNKRYVLFLLNRLVVSTLLYKKMHKTIDIITDILIKTLTP